MQATIASQSNIVFSYDQSVDIENWMVNLMEANYDFQIRALVMDISLKFQKGQFVDAERLSSRQYELLVKLQEQSGNRIHKGGALFNLAISQWFQGKTPESLRHGLLAYVEDLISSSTEFEVDGSPACLFLRDRCGAAWSDLSPVEQEVLSWKRKTRLLYYPTRYLIVGLKYFALNQFFKVSMSSRFFSKLRVSHLLLVRILAVKPFLWTSTPHAF